MLGDLIILADRAAAWLNNVSGEKEQRAAKVLMSAGLLVASLRVLDNSIQHIFGEIKLGVQDLTQEERKKLIRDVNKFAREEVLLQKIRIYSKELERFDVEEGNDVPQSVEQIKRATEKILATLVAGTSPFADEKELEDFLARLRQAVTPEDQAMLDHLCKDILSVYDRNILVGAEHALGALRGSILNRYPRLPNPGWI